MSRFISVTSAAFIEAGRPDLCSIVDRDAPRRTPPVKPFTHAEWRLINTALVIGHLSESEPKLGCGYIWPRPPGISYLCYGGSADVCHRVSADCPAPGTWGGVS